MKVKWNNCFLCLNDLEVSDNITQVKERSKRAEEENGRDCVQKEYQTKTILLLNYLLQTKEHNCKYSGVIDNVRELLTGKTEGGIRFCENCEVQLNVVCELHQQLEVLQMKLVHVLKSIKSTVVQCSKSKTSEGNQENIEHVGLELFEEWLKAQEERCTTVENVDEEQKVGLQEQRKILDTLYAFQAGVAENCIESMDIPRVFLDKMTNFRPNTRKEPDQACTVIVKSEAVDLGPEDMELVDWALDDFANSDPEDGQMREVQKNKIKRKRGRPKKNPTMDVKQDSPDDDPTMGEAEKKGIKRKRGRPKKLPAMDTKEDYPDADVTMGETEKKTIKRKKGRPKKVPAMDIKEETGDIPKKTSRTSSFLALGIISRINRVGKKPRRPKKIEPGTNSNEIVRKRYIRVPAAFAPKPDSKTKDFYRPSIYYGCRTCTYTTRNQFTFEHHLRTHEITAAAEQHANAPIYHCEKCENVTFSIEQHYEFHMAGHDGQLSILCDFCNVMCDPVTLVEHMKTHVEKIFPCPNCSHCSSTRENYLKHLIRTHDGGGTLKCDICEQVFPKKRFLLAHYHQVHQAIEKLVCGVDGCTKEFLCLVMLQGHRKVHENIHVCSHCQKSFRNTAALAVHLLTHTGEKPFPCDKCPEAFNRKQLLESHLMSKHGAPKFKCEHCGHEYTTPGCLKRHMTIHDDSGLPCQFEGCKKKFGNKQVLKRHMLSHSSQRAFICEDCGATFKLAQQFRRHKLIHTGAKNYKCKFCGKAFLFQKYLTCHLRIHTGEKPFVCDMCGRAFNQHAALYQHRRRMHQSQRAPNSSLSVQKDENIDEKQLAFEPSASSDYSQRVLLQ